MLGRGVRGRPTDRYQASTWVRQPISWSGRPRRLWRLAGSWPQVLVYLAGGVALEAADDLGFGQAFLAAPGDVGLGRRVRAHAGDDDPPQGVVGLAVSAAAGAGAGSPSLTTPGSGRTRTGAPMRLRTAAARGGPRRRSAGRRRCPGRRRGGGAGRARGR